MKGHIRQRGKNSWQITIDVAPRDSRGKRHRRTWTVRGNKREAQRKLHEILHSIDQGTYTEPHRMRLSQYLGKWLADYAQSHVAPTTFERYKQIIHQHILPALGIVQLAKLQPTHIQDYYTAALANGRRDGKGGLSTTTVLQHHRVLREALKHALQLQLIARNPADAVKPPPAQRHEVQALNETETRKLLTAVDGTRLHIPVMLALASGMRRGEILGLRWSDINLDEGIITLQRTLGVTSAGLQFREPKTRGSRRSILLPQYAVAVLLRHRAQQSRHRLRLGPAYFNGELVCPRLDGRPWNPDGLSSDFRKFLVAHDLQIVRFHDLRHTHATTLMRLNLHPKVVSERLGHSNVSITLDIYSHVTPGMQKEAADKLDKVFLSSE